MNQYQYTKHDSVRQYPRPFLSAKADAAREENGPMCADR